MRLFLKRFWPYIGVMTCCIAAYIITHHELTKKTVVKEISYTSNTATELYMVWGINYLQMPPKDYWPPGSYEKDSLVYTRIPAMDNKFSINIRLPHGTILNYWMLQKKDKNGNETGIWDAGGDNQQYFIVYFYHDGIFKPGYFIFLAGFLPLLLYYFKAGKNVITSKSNRGYKISEYIPEFDSIRAIAVLLVIIYHWFEENKILNFIPNGPLGVNIFFVLSGFLITGILLKAKKQIETQGLTRSLAFRNFYIRRTLRIFPIYYLLLIIFWLLGDPVIRGNAVYYFTYTSNYLFYSHQDFPARLAHLWSLGVEEQFYILWPFLILLVKRKYLPYLISLFIVIGISSNYIFTEKSSWVEILTPACFDAFSIGAGLSYILAYRVDIIERIQPIYKWIFFAVLFLFILSIFDYSFLPRRTCHALLAVTIIYYCLFKKNNRVMNYVLENKLLMRIGKISYGVYLYHLFVPELWNWVIKRFASWNIDLLFNNVMPLAFKTTWLFIQHFSILMLICIISWNLIEKPINKLKRKFENPVLVKKNNTSTPGLLNL